MAAALRRPSWVDFLGAWALLLLVDLGLRVLPFQRLQAWLGLRKPPAVPALPPEQARDLAVQLHRQVARAARHHLYPMTCLRRSLVLQSLLAQRNIVADLRFGVSKQGAQLQAHAWLEVAGQAIGEPEALTGKFLSLTGWRWEEEP